MAVELKVPEVGESITEVEIASWLKQEGESLQLDEPVVELESAKVTVELPSPATGVLSQVVKKAGEVANVGEVIGYIEERGEAAESGGGAEMGAAAEAEQGAGEEREAVEAKGEQSAGTSESDAAAATATREAGPVRPPERGERGVTPPEKQRGDGEGERGAPAARRAPAEEEAEPGAARSVAVREAERERAELEAAAAGREEEVVSMSPLRRMVADRLVEAQQTAALLTTFNEIDMSAVMSLRERYRETFRERYGVKLGLTSFFVKATVEALKSHPVINAEIRERSIVYRNYYDIGIAVHTPKGLAVPVLRNAERMGFADVEQRVVDLATRAKENKLKIEELEGGTFTITNGGVFGSLLSTPIVNPPQSGILGLHAIQDRPMAEDKQVVVRPMMYVALTYDHRIVDGKGAVTFLRRIKELLEDPAVMLLEI